MVTTGLGVLSTFINCMAACLWLDEAQVLFKAGELYFLAQVVITRVFS